MIEKKKNKKSKGITKERPDVVKNKVGRPTSYRPEYCEELIKLVSKGYSYEAFAGYLQVAVATLYNWEKDFPEFLEAKKIAESVAKYVWEGHGIDGLYEDTEYCPKTGRPLKKRAINSSVWIFNMKNRVGWKDRSEHSVDPDSAPIKLAYDPRVKKKDE